MLHNGRCFVSPSAQNYSAMRNGPKESMTLLAEIKVKRLRKIIKLSTCKLYRSQEKKNSSRNAVPEVPYHKTPESARQDPLVTLHTSRYAGPISPRVCNYILRENLAI